MQGPGRNGFIFFRAVLPGPSRHSIATKRPHEKARLQRKLGVMYQSGALFGSLNVLENARFPLDQFTDLTLAPPRHTLRSFREAKHLAIG